MYKYYMCRYINWWYPFHSSMTQNPTISIRIHLPNRCRTNRTTQKIHHNLNNCDRNMNRFLNSLSIPATHSVTECEILHICIHHVNYCFALEHDCHWAHFRKCHTTNGNSSNGHQKYNRKINKWQREGEHEINSSNSFTWWNDKWSCHFSVDFSFVQFKHSRDMDMFMCAATAMVAATTTASSGPRAWMYYFSWQFHDTHTHRDRKRDNNHFGWTEQLTLKENGNSQIRVASCRQNE